MPQDDLDAPFHARWPSPWFWWWPYRPLFPPGNVPFRQRGWQPDQNGWMIERFRRHLRPWAAHRAASMTSFGIDMNNGTVPKQLPPTASSAK